MACPLIPRRLSSRSFQYLRRAPNNICHQLSLIRASQFHSAPCENAAAQPDVLSHELENADNATRRLTPEQRRFLDGALRVNQAGELAAVLIYDAQMLPIVRAHPHLRTLMKHMYDQEAGHFKIFNAILSKNRIRPTMMYPAWRVAATALGWGTALMGREAAMACTEAVETEIGQHYNDQIRVLLQWAKEAEDKGEDLGPELTELVSTLRRIRDEELEHLDHAVQHDAKEAQPYELLTNVIRSGCRGAIWISERF